MLNVIQFTRSFNTLVVQLHPPRVISGPHLADKDRLVHDYKWQLSRRHICIGTSLFINTTLNQDILSLPAPALAEDNTTDKQEDETVFGTLKSLLDPNEKTKSGKVLPKAYLKSAREVIKTLRESLSEDPKDMAKFRRSADAAKESIRGYLSNWKGQQTVSKEESYVELEKVFRTLASFYANAGPSASMTEEVKSEILRDLDAAEQFL